MKTEAKALLTNRGMLYAIGRVAEYLEKKAETTPELEDKIIASGKGIEECYKYIEFKAKKFANGGMSVMIDDQTVFDWAEHYYAENAACLEEMKPKVQPKPAKAAEAAPAKKTRKKAGAAEQTEAQQKPTDELQPDDNAADEGSTDDVSPETTLSVDAEGVDNSTDEASSETALSVVTDDIDNSTEEAIPVQSEETAKTTDEDKPSEAAAPAPAPVAEPSKSAQIGLDIGNAAKTDPLDLPCAICGKPMREAFAQAPEEKIILWANSFMLNYGRCFCSKEHKEQWLASREGN